MTTEKKKTASPEASPGERKSRSGVRGPNPLFDRINTKVELARAAIEFEAERAQKLLATEPTGDAEVLFAKFARLAGNALRELTALQEVAKALPPDIALAKGYIPASKITVGTKVTIRADHLKQVGLKTLPVGPLPVVRIGEGNRPYVTLQIAKGEMVSVPRAALQLATEAA